MNTSDNDTEGPEATTDPDRTRTRIQPPLEAATTAAGSPPTDRRGGSPDASAPTAPSEAERYHIVGEHARGGLGRVLRAYDRKLSRQVAIKEILDGGAAAEVRFLREAIITARLEHPGIVPIHDVGRWPSGEVFYTMKMVSGRSLADRIKQCATFDQRHSLVPHAAAIADALAYAHDARIIHRDIKPANVLVGPFGETILIDWGLAKDLSAGQGPDEVDTGLGGDEALTLGGSVLGTPAYMPPEQARGEEVGETADVYALGALLYHLLAGQSPYRGQTSNEVLEQVLAGPPAALSSLEPRVPPDLAAIVARAMERRPQDRYPTAAGVAEDLRSYLTGRLVSTFEYSPWHLLRRWLARHRAAVTVAAALLCALGVLGVYSIRSIVAARDLSRQQHALAERRLHEARAVAETILSEADLGLRAVQGAEPIRERLLQSARGLLDRLGEEPGSDTGGNLLARSQTNRKLGDLALSQGNMDAAETAFRASADLAERAVDAMPGDRRAVLELVTASGRLAQAALMSGRVSDAQRLLDRSEPLVRELRRGDSAADDAAVLNAEVLIKQMRAVAALTAGDLEGAERTLRDALGATDGAMESGTTRAGFGLYRLTLLLYLVDVVNSRGGGDLEALTARAVSLAEGADTTRPRHVLVAVLLGRAYLARAMAVRSAGDHEAVGAWLERARAVVEPLLQTESPARTVLEVAGGIYHQLGDVARVDMRPAEAIPWFERSDALLGGVTSDSRDTSLAELLLSAIQGQGTCRQAMGDHAGALRALERARVLGEGVYGTSPSLARGGILLGGVYLGLGASHLALGHTEEANEWLDRSLERLDAVHRTDPSNRDATVLLAHAHMHRGDAAYARGDLAGADGDYRPMLELATAAAAPQGEDPSATRCGELTGLACVRLANLGLAARSAEQAEPWIHRAIEAFGCDPADVASRSGLVHARALLASAAVLRGDLDEAAARLEEAHQLRDLPEPYGAPVRAMLKQAYEQFAQVARAGGRERLAALWAQRAPEIAAPDDEP